MKLYFAPLEGIGGYIYRNAHAAYFPKADKYFAPFLVPVATRDFTAREAKDIAPEHNRGICLIPQIMTDDAALFLHAAEKLRRLGYAEVNLNLGCPSRTVVTKGRGAGFLAKPERLDAFLDRIFSGTDLRISIKTRLGIADPQEFERLLAIYNQYPLEELIVHPRVQEDYYKKRPRMESFAYALERSKNPVVYNGDIFREECFWELYRQYPQVDRVMAGRGVLSDPCLFGSIRKEETLGKKKLWSFHERLLGDYEAALSGEKTVLYRMKELWGYMIHVFSDHEKVMKKIRKVQKLAAYREIVRGLFDNHEIQKSTFCGD